MLTLYFSTITHSFLQMEVLGLRYFPSGLNNVTNWFFMTNSVVKKNFPFSEFAKAFMTRLNFCKKF